MLGLTISINQQDICAGVTLALIMLQAFNNKSAVNGSKSKIYFSGSITESKAHCWDKAQTHEPKAS